MNHSLRGTEFTAADVALMLKLDLYDMVDFGKEFDAAGYDLLNHFEGWLMP